MSVREVRDPAAIRGLLDSNPYLHILELGDLDPFFWPSTRWFVRDGAVALLYAAGEHNVLLCFRRTPGAAEPLLVEIRDELPPRLYAHLSPGLYSALEPRFATESHLQLQKMALRHVERLSSEAASLRTPRTAPIDGDVAAAHADAPADLCDPTDAPDYTAVAPVVPLGPGDAEELRAFYREAYPHNWFDARMLETGKYLGLRATMSASPGRLLAVAGIHVYSPTERVAALGNVATLPAARGRGLATVVCRALCRMLVGEGLRVGLNVARDNQPAIRCYESLGFVHEADYEERSLSARRASPRESE